MLPQLSTGAQVAIPLPLSPPPQPSQLPGPEVPAPSAIVAIWMAFSVAWTADRLIPRARKTPRTRANICRDDRRFIIIVKMAYSPSGNK